MIRVHYYSHGDRSELDASVRDQQTLHSSLMLALEHRRNIQVEPGLKMLINQHPQKYLPEDSPLSELHLSLTTTGSDQNHYNFNGS